MRLATRNERADMRPRELTLYTARDWIGLEEREGNTGPAVELFLALTGLGPGAPWCAAFVNACAQWAWAMRDRRSPLEEVPHQALVQSYVEYGRDRGWHLRHQDWERVVPGDLFCLWHPSKDRYAHIGFVYDPPKAGELDGRYTTIEGNTNEAGEREGRFAMSRERPVTKGTLWLRWWDE